MAKYFVEDASLLNIAHAIRRKTGDYTKLTLDGMVTAIEGIEAGGGGLPSGVTALASGTFTPATDVTSQYAVPHGLGIMPNFFVVAVEGQETLMPADFSYYITHEYGLVQNFVMNANEAEAFRIYRYSNGNIFSQAAAASFITVFANTIYFYPYASTTYSLKAGVTYRWVAGVIDGI